MSISQRLIGAESAFRMTKAKFGDSVRSRTETAMRNEVYCKFIAPNICCVIMSPVELGIEPIFWSETRECVKAVEPVPTPAAVVVEQPIAEEKKVLPGAV